MSPNSKCDYLVSQYSGLGTQPDGTSMNVATVMVGKNFTHSQYLCSRL